MTTTIEIDDDQKDALESLKEHEREPMKSVVGRLIASYSNDGDEAIDGYSESDSDAIAGYNDDGPAAPATGQDIEAVLETLSAIDDRTGSIERMIEDLQRGGR